jgi:hypothetical protein
LVTARAVRLWRSKKFARVSGKTGNDGDGGD